MGATIPATGDPEPARKGGRRRATERRRQIAAMCGVAADKAWVERLASESGLSISDTIAQALRAYGAQRGCPPPPPRR